MKVWVALVNIIYPSRRRLSDPRREYCRWVSPLGGWEEESRRVCVCVRTRALVHTFGRGCVCEKGGALLIEGDVQPPGWEIWPQFRRRSDKTLMPSTLHSIARFYREKRFPNIPDDENWLVWGVSVTRSEKRTSEIESAHQLFMPATWLTPFPPHLSHQSLMHK